MSSEYMEKLTNLMLEKVKAERTSLGLKVLGWMLFLNIFLSLYSSGLYMAGGFLFLTCLCFTTAYLCDLWSEHVGCKIKSLRYYEKST